MDPTETPRAFAANICMKASMTSAGVTLQAVSPAKVSNVANCVCACWGEWETAPHCWAQLRKPPLLGAPSWRQQEQWCDLWTSARAWSNAGLYDEIFISSRQLPTSASLTFCNRSFKHAIFPNWLVTGLLNYHKYKFNSIYIIITICVKQHLILWNKNVL